MITDNEQAILYAVDELRLAIQTLTIDSTDATYNSVRFPEALLEQIEQGIWAVIGKRTAGGS